MDGRRRNSLTAVGTFLFGALLACAEAGAGAVPVSPLHRTCDLIAQSADNHGLPRPFLARLIWKESRFDPGAVSPKGAEGIAQFMPGTAEMRGLENAFDIEQAIPASAEYLAELAGRFGNLGLAAAAYNAGERRVGSWLGTGGFLPLETENFVLDIMGAPADSFAGAERAGDVVPLHPEKSFAAACRDMPAIGSSLVAMSEVPVLPWGIQVAGSFNRAAAIRRWQEIMARNADLLGGAEPVISRIRSARGRAGLHAVRIGAETREEADRLCDRLRAAGGACIVMRNR